MLDNDKNFCNITPTEKLLKLLNCSILLLSQEFVFSNNMLKMYNLEKYQNNIAL